MPTTMKKNVQKPQTQITTRVRSKKRVVAEWLFGLFSFVYFLFYWENNVVDVEVYETSDPRIPRELDGLTIVQVSDLHGKTFGRGNKKLLDKIRARRPDLIAITGDLIDERDPSPDYARRTVDAFKEIAPVFYVTGNHEGAFIKSLRDDVLAAIENAGAFMLEGVRVELSRGTDGALVVETLGKDSERAPTPRSVLLAGICDPKKTYASETSRTGPLWRESEIVDELLDEVPNDPTQYSILLSHRPEQIRKYAEHKFDLVLTGHAHGGQFRLPLLLPNGLFAPEQGYFPRYTSGRYVLDDTTEIVSRGLGPSVIPTRLFNRPCLVVCVLKTQEQ